MKGLIIALIICFWNFSILCQVKIKYGEAHMESKIEYPIKHLISTSNSHVFELSNYNGLKIGRYTLDLNYIGSVEIKSSSKGRIVDFLFGIKDKIYIVASSEKEEKDHIVLNIAQLNEEGKFLKEKEICRIKVENKKDIPTVEYMLSPDSTKICFMAVLDHNIKKKNLEVYFSVLDLEIKELWSKQYKFPISQNDINITASGVNNEGSVVLNTANLDSKPYRNETYFFKVSDTSTPINYFIDLGNTHINSCLVTSDSKSNFYIAGIAGNKEGALNNKLFMTKLSSSGELLIKNKIIDMFKNKPDNLILDDVLDEEKKEYYLNKNTELMELNVNEDETYDFIIQRRYYSTSGNGRYYWTVTKFKELLAIKVDTSLEVDKILFCNRNQTFDYEFFGGSFVSKYKSGYLAIHNDSSENYNRRLGESVKHVSNEGMITFVDMNQKGPKILNAYTKENKFDDYLLCKETIAKIGPNKFIFCSIKGGWLGLKDVRLAEATIN